MKYLVLVKGDGRGHLTQALALAELLTARGHHVCAFVVGKPAQANLPAFFAQRAQAPVVPLESPNFRLTRNRKRIAWGRTLVQGLLHLPAYRRSVRQLHTLLCTHHPDVIVNLYEPLATLHRWLYGRTRARVVHISHQALLLHPAFEFPAGGGLSRRLVVGYTRFVNRSADKSLALSFYPLPPAAGLGQVVVAPLLRQAVFDHTPSAGGHILAYMVYPGFADTLLAFAQRHPEVPVVAFWNNPEAPATRQLAPNLVVHQVNDTLFLEHLASCRGVATTAGFETVAEALYYGKPAILMPMPGQYEQTLNAHDAQRVGAGVPVTALDPEQLLAFEPHYRPDTEAYRRWLAEGSERLIFHLENPAAHPEARPSAPKLQQPSLVL